MNDACPKCGGEMYQSEKYTGGGTDWREYTCRSCGHREDENRGKALWQILSDDRENTEAARGTVEPKARWLDRILGFLRRSH